ncbi:MAG: hypothetical protein K9L62_02095 [Vallitaleaceae bacterium]|nr:hypothetical protein [Vallitaleaceae bacterium]
MFKKTKDFYNEHKGTIILVTVGTAACIGAAIVGIKLSKIEKPIGVTIPTVGKYDWNANREVLENFGLVFKEGCSVPFATKEVALKFLEERGNSYQIDIMDDMTSVIWIYNGEL